MPTLTLCAIVRNEAPNIARMLASVQGLVDEMILLDTGSVDDTVAIARSLGATVHETTWPGSFSAARNHAMALCSGDWLLSLDGDEALERQDMDEVRRRIQDPDEHVVMVELVNYLAGGQTNRFHYPRLYRRDPRIHYVGKVHNQLIYPGTASVAPIRVYHWGYQRSGEARLRRLQQTLDLCREMVAEAPGDPSSHYYLAQTQFQLGDYPAAVANSRKVLNMLPGGLPPPGSFLGDTYFKLAYHAFLSANYPEAEQWIQDGLAHGGNQVDLNFLGGRTMRALGRHDAAAAYWQSYLAAVAARAHGDRRDVGLSTNFDNPEARQEAWQGLAKAYLHVGGPDAVAPILAEWRTVSPTDPEPLAQQIWLDLRRNRPAEAWERYQRQAPAVPSHDWLEAGGMMAALTVQHPQAETMARTLLRRQPVRWLLYEYFARWLAAQRRTDEAAALIGAWCRWVPGDPRAQALLHELKLSGAVGPEVPAVAAALPAPVAALLAAGEVWAGQPEDPDLRERYLAVRSAGCLEGGRRLLIGGPPDAMGVARLRAHLQGLRPVRWDRPLAAGETALILAAADDDQRRRWLDVLPREWPLAVAVDPLTPSGWAQTAGLLAAGHVPLPILATQAIPGTAESPEDAVCRWQTAAADVLAPLRAAAPSLPPRLMLTGTEGHTDLAAAALQSLGVVGGVHPGQERLDAAFWLPASEAAEAGEQPSPWPWVFPLAGMWLSRAPEWMTGPLPAPVGVHCAGRPCRVDTTATGWRAKLPPLPPGWHDVTVTGGGFGLSWRFGCSAATPPSGAPDR